MKQSILGVIGGLGPETGCRFCLNINNTFKQITKRQPHILLDNLPISQEAEEHLINGGPSQEHFDLLVKSVQRLNTLKANLIVIPCNTVHIFIDDLRKLSKVSILSIIEETSKECTRRHLKKVGLVASTKTVQERLHANELRKHGIRIILPSKEDQMFISACIIRIINNATLENDRQRLCAIIKRLEMKGAEGIILGCTDLPALILSNDVSLPLFNTTKILERATLSKLCEEAPTKNSAYSVD